MDRPNIILIVLDTMRRDALGTYGKLGSTPYTEQFAGDSYVFENAVSTSPWTIPSHASLFTGSYPIEHRINAKTLLSETEQVFKILNTESFVLKLKKLGYNTTGLSANGLVSPELNFDSGFDEFANINFWPSLKNSNDKKVGQEEDKSFLTEVKNYIAETRYRKHKKYPEFKGGQEIVDSVKKLKFEDNFFLFLNFMEMHEPYFPKSVRPASHYPFYNESWLYKIKMEDYFGVKPVKNNFVHRLRKLYYGQANIIDSFMGELFNFLKESKLYDDTLIILTSDHGQSLKDEPDHALYHEAFLYDEMVDVPLIVKPPLYDLKDRSEPRVVSNQVSNIIASTIIDEGQFRLNSPYLEEYSTRGVFTESYGLNPSIGNDKFRERYEKYKEKYELMTSPRKAIYKDGLKLVVNGETGTVEEFKSITNSSEDIDKEKMYGLLDDLSIFVGNTKFKIPETQD